GDPLGELRERGRIVEVDVPAGSGSTETRYVLTETSARYASAFGAVSPTRTAARREILVRFISLAGAVSVDDVIRRYALDPDWVRERFDEWTRNGRLVRGRFGGDATDRWCSRRLLEQARRRELAQARKQIQAVDLERFSRFMFRWQHVAPSTRL